MKELVIVGSLVFLSVSWSEGNQEDVENAIADYLDAAPSQADIDEYKRLKAKLGL